MTRIHVPIGIRFNDLDAYGHVNNAAMLTLLEEARIAVFWSAGDLQVDGVNDNDAPVADTSTATTITLVARQEVEYLAPIPYLREPLDVQLWIGRLGGASLDVCYEIASPAGDEEQTMFAKAATTIVLVDAASGRPRRITEREREAWAAHVDAPVVFAKRS
ncbi:acyl-CoA thioesterase [Pseudolysinimonas sp.]|jgi:acyl-CoA thioester hydrolase|uniref:acyl-CoA thioesterase n=1 Tax=Pseudolysinimonas sp. TaxID=2680009 RepID=UPI0037846A75